MKIPALLFLATTLAAGAAETAYTALRAVGKAKGETTLDRVVELRGRAGAPEPEVWKITVRDDGARGGVREFEVQRGKIISERAPTAPGAAGAAINLNQLNLDSDGAFQVVDKEMQKQRVPFNRLEYTLRSGSNGGTPVWSIDVSDTKRGRVAAMELSAESGALLGQRRIGPGPDTSRDREFLAENPPPQREVRVVDEDENDPVYRGRSAEREELDRKVARGGVTGFVHRVDRHFRKRGDQLRRFFGGEDPDER